MPLFPVSIDEGMNSVSQNTREAMGIFRGDIFATNNKHYLCTYKIIFSEYGLSSQIVSDVDKNFISEKFKTVCKWLGIYYALSSSYNQQGSKQMELCTQFFRRIMKECYETNADIYMIYIWYTHMCLLLQIR